jgi:DNA replication licensing factor MCM7
MDDVNEGGAQSRGARRRNREQKLKYMQMLQDVADRERADVLIELDDLVAVSAALRI